MLRPTDFIAPLVTPFAFAIVVLLTLAFNGTATLHVCMAAVIVFEAGDTAALGVSFAGDTSIHVLKPNLRCGADVLKVRSPCSLVLVGILVPLTGPNPLAHQFGAARANRCLGDKFRFVNGVL
jgi:hypothetical protein